MVVREGFCLRLFPQRNNLECRFLFKDLLEGERGEVRRREARQREWKWVKSSARK